MNRFIVDRNIANFIHRFCEVDGVAERNVLRRLLVAEITQFDGVEERLDAVVTVIDRLHREIESPAAKMDNAHETGLRELLRLFEEQRRRLT